MRAPSQGNVGALLRNVLLERNMASLPLHKASRLSVDLFRGFLGGRPDEERWELIDGVAVMIAPPTKAHQRIASNLERLLNDALERHDPALAAYSGQDSTWHPRSSTMTRSPTLLWSMRIATMSVIRIAFIWRPKSCRQVTQTMCKANATCRSCMTPAAPF